MFVRSPYNYDTNAESDACGLYCDPETDEGRSRTVQSQADEADINVIVKRFGLTGQMPQSIRIPTYGDFDQISDFQSAMNVIRGAQESFMSLPWDLRARFHNDPQEYLEFVGDVDSEGKYKNLDEMKKLGLLKPEDPVKIDPLVESINNLTEAYNGNRDVEEGVTGGSAPSGSSKGGSRSK